MTTTRNLTGRISNNSFEVATRSAQEFACTLHRLSLGFILLALIFLAGCETTPPGQTSSTAPPLWESRQQQLGLFNAWNIKGKLAVIQSDRRDSLVINYWQQIEDHFDIHVSSLLLGLGATRISGTPEYLVLQQADELPVDSSYPERLLERSLGWSLPLDSLPYWIKGLPREDTVAETSFDEQGNLYQLKQSGWQMTFARYTMIEELILPTKVTLRKDNIRLKVIISEWNPGCLDC